MPETNEVKLPRCLLFGLTYKFMGLGSWMEVNKTFEKWGFTPLDFADKDEKGEPLLGSRVELEVPVKVGLLKDIYDSLKTQPYEKVFSELNLITTLMKVHYGAGNNTGSADTGNNN